tara:strand:+ start:2206 stop:2520 length:315 start_codon:yes stop_codon:yes gene_type:complete
MATIITSSINVSKIPKEEIIDGKKGKYVPITITINDEVDQFGQQGSVTLRQSKEQRENKEPKVYLGNLNVVWTNGQNVEPAPRDNVQSAQTAHKPEPVADDLPF